MTPVPLALVTTTLLFGALVDPAPDVMAEVRRILDPSLDYPSAVQAMDRLAQYEPEELGAAVTALGEALASPDGRVRLNALFALDKLGPVAEPQVARLIAFIRDPARGQERGSAAIALGRIGRRPEKVVPVLVRLLEDSSYDTRRAACFALMQFRAEAAPAVPALRVMLNRPNEYDRMSATATLGEIGAPAAPAVPELLQLLQDGSALDKVGAARALGGIGAVNDKVVPALVGALRDNQTDVQVTAVRALGDIGPPAAEEALPAIRAFQPTEKSELTWLYARVRLGDSEPALKRLTELALADPPSAEVFDSLARLRGAGVPALVEVIARGAPGTLWAIQAVEKIGPDATSAVPALAEMIRSPRPRGAKSARFDAAVRALGAIGPAAKEALPALEQLAKSSTNETVQRAARRATRQINKQSA